MMITSKKGNEMLQHITPMYQKSIIEQAVYEAIGQEWDSADELAQEVLLQLFPQTATWGLIFWEKRVGLTINTNEDIERRRRKVIAKMQTRYPINPKNMARIIKNYIGVDTLITENIAPYTFEIKLISKEGLYDKIQGLYEIVKKIKPCHLSVQYKLISIIQSNLYCASTLLSGEEITVYPKRR